MLYSDITELIGNTPLLRLDPGKHGIDGAEVYAKLEFCNPFGSVKDRIAWGMIRDDLPGITSRGQTLIEASSGNTAKALQVLAAMHGIRLRVLTNRTKVPEVRDALELLGGELEELPGLSECPDPTVPNDVFGAIEKLMAENPAPSTTPRSTPASATPSPTRTPPGKRSSTTSARSTSCSAAWARPVNPRRGDVPAGGEPSAADHRHRLHQGRLHPRYPVGGGAVGGRAVRARLLRRDHAGPVGRCDRRGGGPGPPAWGAGRPHQRSRLLGGPAVPAAAAARGRRPAAGGHHRDAARAHAGGARLAGAVTGTLDYQAAPAVLMSEGKVLHLVMVQ